MTIARAQLVDPDVTRWYHCVTRCVRRAFLLGEGGTDRKQWIENRLQELAGLFSIAVGGFAVLDNHLFLCLMTVGLILPNATAAVMAPFPHQAGAASALLGMLPFTVGAATGAIVGIFHDGTNRPMALTIAGCAATSALITILVERRNSAAEDRAVRLLGQPAESSG